MAEVDALDGLAAPALALRLVTALALAALVARAAAKVSFRPPARRRSRR
jgi:hypothetical protein